MPTPESRTSDLIATGMVATWALGASFTGRCGIWGAIGPTAVFLALVAITSDGERLRSHLRPSVSGLTGGLAVGAGMTIATHLLFPPATALVPWLGDDVARVYGQFQAPGVTRALLYLPIIITCEEIVWRGVVHDALARHSSRTIATLVGAVVYAAAHAPVGSPGLVATCIGVGVCWGGLRAWTNGLFAPVLSHLLWDVLVLVLWPVIETT